MIPPLYERLTYETFIGLSAYATMGVFFLTTILILEWDDIKRDIPAFGWLFRERGVISEGVALSCFWTLLIAMWVASAVIADFMFM